MILFCPSSWNLITQYNITNCCSNYYVHMKCDSSNSRFYHYKVNEADIYVYTNTC